MTFSPLLPLQPTQHQSFETQSEHFQEAFPDLILDYVRTHLSRAPLAHSTCCLGLEWLDHGPVFLLSSFQHKD